MADDDIQAAGSDTGGGKAAPKSDWEAVHDRAMEEYARDYEHDRRNIELAYEDLAFRRGELEDQWDKAALDARKGRPTHVINEIPQFVRQVTGDMRQAKPGIKVVPVDSNADPKTAEVLAGMVRYIENRSYAQSVYTQAADSQVTCGIGHWRVLTEYASSTTFNQEIRIGAIGDGVAVIWDADAVLPTREDAMHVFVPVDMSIARFKDQWPKAKVEGFEIKEGTPFYDWYGDDFIRVAEYWVKKPIKRLLAMAPDGAITDLTDRAADLDDDTKALYIEQAKAQGYRVERRDSFKVCQYKMTCAEILEENEWQGLHIPIVPVIGEEVYIGRSVYRHGIVRYAKEPQRMANYYASAETETIALQPKAPWIGTRKQFENNYDLWETANTENHPFLEYTPDPQAGGPPQRVAPPVASQAIMLGKQQASEKMRAVIGIYDASLGARSNETSGIAIRRRDAQADTGTYVYHANFSLAIQRTGQIIVDLAPHIYDSQRTVRIIGDDGKQEMKEINKPTLRDGVETVMNDITTGSYDVMTVAGPAYATRREEARDGMTALFQAFPAAAPVLGDKYAKLQDWPDAEEIGERLESLLPPAIKAQIKQRNQDPNEPPQPPSPEEQAAAQEAEVKQRAVMIELEGKELDNQQKRVDIAAKAKEVQQPSDQPDHAAAIKAQAEMVKAENDARLADLEYRAKEQELAQKQRMAEVELQIKMVELASKQAGIVHSHERHATTMVHDAERHEQERQRQQEPAE
jgi:hypothetical protein